MKESTLLASLALFGELYDGQNNKNVNDTIADLIKYAVVKKHYGLLSSTELKELINSTYDFDIPESVIRSVIKSRLKSQVEIKNGLFYFRFEYDQNQKDLEKELESIQETQKNIFENLILFIEKKEKRVLTDEKKIELFVEFSDFILDNSSNGEFKKNIASFFLENINGTDIKDKVNTIRDGYIIYQGIRFTPDLNNLDHFSNLTILLSPEHLFNCVGYNGELYEGIFGDFMGLVNEINESQKKKGRVPVIQVKYIEETKQEVDRFFQAAEEIIRKRRVVQERRPAMEYIFRKCSTPVEIAHEKIKFYKQLDANGIQLHIIDDSVYGNPKYITEDATIIEQHKTQFRQNNRLDEEYINVFRIFTKVIYFRKGLNNRDFTKIPCIYMTDSKFALSMSHLIHLRDERRTFPYARDIDYVINNFWFRLKKGFGERERLPKSFDIIARTQIIVASQIRHSLSRIFFELQEKIGIGNISPEDAIELVEDLRSRYFLPEDINPDTLGDSLSLLVDDSATEELLRRHHLKDQKIRDMSDYTQKLEGRLQEYEEKDRLNIELERTRKTEENKKVYCEEKWKKYLEGAEKERRYVFTTIGKLISFNFLIFILDSKFNFLENSLLKLLMYFAPYILKGFETAWRSYVVDKDLFKLGWNSVIEYWKLDEIKQQKFAEYSEEFDLANKSI